MKPDETKQDDNVIVYPKKRQFNIGILIFSIIFIYLIATIIMYITAPHVSVYEVRQGTILKDNAYTGLALRNESVVYSDTDGYVNYFTEETSKVKIGSSIYTTSAEKLNLDDHLSDKEIALSKEEEKNLLLKIQSYNLQFDQNNYATTYQLKSELQHTVDKLASQSKTDQLKELLSLKNDQLMVHRSSKDGIVIFASDGLEQLTIDNVNSSHLNKSNYKNNEFTNNRLVHTGDPVYKIITDDSWQLLIEISQDTKNALIEKKSVKVRFKKDNQELRASISLLENMEKPTVCLSFQNSMIRYANERYLDIELILEDETGLKIPKSAETSKRFYVVPESYLTMGGNTNTTGVMRKRTTSDGETITEFINVTVYYQHEGYVYLDPNVFDKSDVLIKTDSMETFALSETRSLKGVFCINKGYAVFKQIKILCESDEYYIVEEGNSFGLSNYDHIALDGKSIKENDVVF